MQTTASRAAERNIKIGRNPASLRPQKMEKQLIIDEAAVSTVYVLRNPRNQHVIEAFYILPQHRIIGPQRYKQKVVELDYNYWCPVGKPEPMSRTDPALQLEKWTPAKV